MSVGGAAWRSYEEVAAHLLNELAAVFDLEVVEGKQRLKGRVQTWEIDGKAWKRGNDGFLVVECRRKTTSRIDQEQVAAVAYRIHDLGADGGIIVSPLGL